MATDLDRAYIINGDDLRIALGKLRPLVIHGGNLLPDVKLHNPEFQARAILADVAKPLDDSRFPITRADLVTRLGFALAETKVTLTPHELAARLVADIETQSCPCGGPESECACLNDNPMPEAARKNPDREVDAISRIYDTLIALDDADAVGRVLSYLTERCLGVKP